MARSPAKGRSAPASQADVPAAPARANRDRGEHLLELAGVTYKLRPSYDAIVEMEEATGLSLVDLTRKADRHGLSLPEAAKVAAALIRAGAEDPLTRMVSADVLGGQIFEQGVISVVIRLTLCLSDAVGGGRTASGEAKAAVA